jgi:hypothetical protein
MENLFVLPTDKPSRLYLYQNKLGLAIGFQYGSDVIINQHVYITNDELPKLDEWGVNNRNGVVFKCKGFTPDTEDKKYNRKIILTTDQDLIKDGVQAIPDDFLEWFVKNPSCEEVEVKSEILYEHKDTYRPYQSDCKNLTKTKINYYLSIIPKEEPKEFDIRELNRLDDIEIEEMSNDWATMSQQIKPKQETLEEVAERFYGEEEIVNDYDISGYLQSAFLTGAKWQQEQIYNKIKELYDNENITGFSKRAYAQCLDIIEQFKKK